MINSTDVVKSTTPNGLLKSLDVESLFTNISLAEYIYIYISVKILVIDIRREISYSIYLL